MTRTVTITCEVPRSVNRTRGQHPMAAHREKKRLERALRTMLMVKQVPMPIPGGRLHATALLTFPTLRARDEGNYRAPLEKALGDALCPKPGRGQPASHVAAPYLPDDTPEHFTFGEVRFARQPGLPTCTITLEWKDN